MSRESPSQKPDTESERLEQVRDRAGAQQSLRALQAEIAGEIAYALGRTEEQLKLALEELGRRSTELASLRAADASGPDLEAATDAFNHQRRLAQKRLLDLVIHREAAGFRRNQEVYERYPIPPPER